MSAPASSVVRPQDLSRADAAHLLALLARLRVTNDNVWLITNPLKSHPRSLPLLGPAAERAPCQGITFTPAPGRAELPSAVPSVTSRGHRDIERQRVTASDSLWSPCLAQAAGAKLSAPTGKASFLIMQLCFSNFFFPTIHSLKYVLPCSSAHRYVYTDDRLLGLTCQNLIAEGIS